MSNARKFFDITTTAQGPFGDAIVDPFVPRGQAVVEYVGTYDFAALGVREPKEIVARLRATLAQASGWPVRDG